MSAFSAGPPNEADEGVVNGLFQSIALEARVRKGGKTVNHR